MRYGWSHWSNEASVADHGDGVGSHRNGHGPIRLDHEDSAAAAGYMRGYRQDSRGTYIPYPTFQVGTCLVLVVTLVTNMYCRTPIECEW